MIFRAVQDLLSKALRQPSVGKVDLHLNVKSSVATVEVRDDGDASLMQDMDNPENFAVMLLRNRLLEFGGRFDMHALQPSGMEIIFALPIQPLASRSE